MNLLGVVLGGRGPLLGGLERLLAALARSWAVLGGYKVGLSEKAFDRAPLREVFGRSWAVLGRSWGVLAASLSGLRPSWDPRGAILEPSWEPKKDEKDTLRKLTYFLASWGHRRAS